MRWTFDDIPALADQFVEDWKKRHPNHKPSFTGRKLTIDDQYERNNYGKAQPCTIRVMTSYGPLMKPSAINIQPSVIYQQRETERELYDERKL